MLINPGEKLHIIKRRLFETDVRRHFAGEVTSATENAVRLVGFAFVFDSARNEFVKRPELRTRIVALTSGSHIINILPQEVQIEALHYQLSPERHLVITDGKNFSLDINEFGMSR
jgi:hypothetical protein